MFLYNFQIIIAALITERGVPRAMNTDSEDLEDLEENTALRRDMDRTVLSFVINKCL